MRVNVDIDIENARKALTLSAGSIEEAKLYENYTDEEIKDKVLSHCKCWGITEYKNSNNGSSDDIELEEKAKQQTEAHKLMQDMARAASRYMQGKSITDMVDDSGKKHEVTVEDMDMAKKFLQFANYIDEVKELIIKDIDKEDQFEEIWDRMERAESNVKESYETYVVPVDTIKMILDKHL